MAAELEAVETGTTVVAEVPRGDASPVAAVVRFYVAPGDRVEAGTAMCRLRTARFLYDLPAPSGGVVEELLVEPDEQIAIGTPLLHIRELPDEPDPEEQRQPQVRATPLARTIAAAHGYDLTLLAGSSVDGRIRAADVRAVVGEPIPGRVDAAVEPHTEVASFEATSGAVIRPLAPPLLLTHDDRPHACTTVEVDCGADVVPDNTVLILHALLQALVEHPWLNSCWTDAGVLVYGRIDLGIWCDRNGSLRPTLIPHAADLSPRGIARALHGDPAATDPCAGCATFNILLSSGASWSEPIIPRGTAALLHIGGVERRVVVEPATERVVIRARRILALVYDARHIAQPEADSLLQDVRVRVERHHPL